MNIKLVYDTETTGLPLFDQPSDDPRQPHIVQLAACLIDVDTRRTLAAMDVIVRPDGWVIPDEVAAIHGITTELASEVGIPERVALSMLMELWNGRTRVAHNESFDARIVRIALKRHFDPIFIPLIADTATPAVLPSDEWKAGAAECTARMATPICNLPPTEKMLAANRRHAKTPNLSEAYQHFTGQALENAHSAQADVKACAAIYFAMLDLQEAEAA